MKPPEVQETSLSTVASPPALLPTATPPLLSPISPEVSLPSPALPPALPPPPLPSTAPIPLTTSPPELLHEVAPPPPATQTPVSSMTTPPPLPTSPAASRPPHSKLPEVSQPPRLEPNLLPSPELRTHLPIAPPQNSPDPKIHSAPPTKTPPFFPIYDDPPPPPPPPSSRTSPTLSSSGLSSTIGNQTTLDLEQSHVSTGIFLGCVTGGVLLIAILALLYLCTRNPKHPKKIDHVRPWLGLKDNSCAVIPQNWEQAVASLDIVTVQPQPQCSVHITSHNSGSQHPSLTCGDFTYDELEVATDGFSKANLVGEGGFGYVHRGVLANGREVAVKRLKTRSKQGEIEFEAEVETFSQVHHKHIVTLLGYCIAGSERLLVYEFIPNKTLEFHLHGKEQPTMEWATRVKIAIGAAKGLAYLHEDCNPTIVHRDIKAANILLDFKFDAKVSDFGLANFFSDKSNASCITHISTRVIGTFGYLAPEYASSGKVTEKSDVYSYGVMLLELITGCPPICRTQDPTMKAGLVGWARPLLTQALQDANYTPLADPSLQGNYNADEMAIMVSSAAACVRHSPLLRPRMSQIVRVLERDVSPAELNEEGRTPRHKTLSGFLESSTSYDAYQYKEKLKEYNKALASLEHGITRYSGSASEYSLYKSESGSSCEMQRPT